MNKIYNLDLDLLKTGAKKWNSKAGDKFQSLNVSLDTLHPWMSLSILLQRIKKVIPLLPTYKNDMRERMSKQVLERMLELLCCR